MKSFKQKVRFTQNQVDAFAEVSGDKNPIHLDAAYASKTIFKKRIVHGALGTGVFSKILGTKFPGEGTIYLMQNSKFISPIYVDVDYEVVIEIIEEIPEKSRLKLSTTLRNTLSKDECIIGEALVMNKQYFKI